MGFETPRSCMLPNSGKGFDAHRPEYREKVS